MFNLALEQRDLKRQKKKARSKPLMVEWYRASASGSVDLGFDSESDQIIDFKIGIHNFPA